MEILREFNDEGVTVEESKDFQYRIAVRVVALDNDGNMGLLHVTRGGYYAIPGGAVDPGETLEQAALREVREEIGCNVQLGRCLGRILEYARDWKSINDTTMYLARVIGEKGTPVWIGDEDEDEKSAVVEWVPISEAILRIEALAPQKTLYKQYYIDRTLTFLKKALDTGSF